MDSGWLDLQGDLACAPRETGSDLRFTGRASVDSLVTRDQTLGERFVAWEALQVEGIQAELPAGGLRVGSVTARASYGKVAIAQDGSLNLADVLAPRRGGPAGTGTSGAAEAPAEAPAEEAQGPREEPAPAEMGVVRIEQGSADFQDLSPVPQVSARIQELDGKITGLSPANLSRADVSLEGKVGAYGTVRVDGKINRIGPDACTDLHVVFGNVELTTLSPYSGKFTGYVIDEGKLSLDLQCKLSDRKLLGERRGQAAGEARRGPARGRERRDRREPAGSRRPGRPGIQPGGDPRGPGEPDHPDTAASPFTRVGSLGGMDGRPVKQAFDRAGYRRGLRERLIDAEPLEEAELRQLAMDRATAVKTFLVREGGMDHAPIFILEAKPAAAVNQGGVRTELAHTSR